MRYIYRTRKIKILIEILQYDVLVKADDKCGTLLSAISETKEDFEQDIKDLLKVCPNKSAKKWVNQINWDAVERTRYCMSDSEFTLTMFTVAKQPGKLKAMFN